MNRWEYRVIEFESEAAGQSGKWQLLEPIGGAYVVLRSEAELAGLLLYAGGEGWELVTVVVRPGRDRETLYLKRPR